MTWAVWLAVPVVLTALACVVTWWRNRPVKAPTTAQAMREHTRYLDALDRARRDVGWRDAGSRDVGSRDVGSRDDQSPRRSRDAA